MNSMTSATFVATLRASSLLEAPQLTALDQATVPGDDPRLLARQCVHQGWLTPYQVNQLLQGRGAQLVLGSYVLLERLGEGGMGQVFKARHRTLERLVALKVIRRERAADAEAVARFRREIDAVARLSHPNIVLALDAGEAAGTLYFVMEHIEGTSLSQQVKKCGPLPAALACEYLRQAALGLQHIHEHGMVHRDIKPSNLLLAANGSVLKILDLGLARLDTPAIKDGDGEITHAGRLMGTPDFIAAEQAANSHQADIRSDLYSVGCTFYYAVTGSVPFPGGSTVEKLFRHMGEEATPPEHLCPELPGEVGAIIRKLMAKRAADRYQTPRELADDLSRYLSSVSRVPTIAPVPRETTGDTFDFAAGSGRKTRGWTGSRSPRFLLAAVGLLCAVMTGLGALVLRGNHSGEASVAPPTVSQGSAPRHRYERRSTWAETVLATLKENGAPTLEGKWHIIGPFDNVQLEHGRHRGFTDVFPPEKEIDLAKSYAGKGGEKVAWKELKFPLGQMVDLRMFKNNDWSCVYLYHEIEVSEAVALPLALGSDDTLTVWLNGERLLARDRIVSQSVDPDRVTLNLKPGKNTLLLKVCNGNANWWVYVMPQFPAALERSFGDSVRRDFPLRNGTR